MRIEFIFIMLIKMSGIITINIYCKINNNIILYIFNK